MFKVMSSYADTTFQISSHLSRKAANAGIVSCAPRLGLQPLKSLSLKDRGVCGGGGGGGHAGGCDLL